MQTLTINNRIFNLVETGGGCTALEYIDNNLSYMITAHEDVNAPINEDEKIDLGIYDITADHSEPFIFITNININNIQF